LRHGIEAIGVQQELGTALQHIGKTASTAVAVKMAAPLMSMPFVVSPSPPITATSPWLPLWLAWCLGAAA
jgi:hypothetical protein